MPWTEKFVTATASGGGSGNSEGDAYTLTEMMTGNHAAGNFRYNIKAGTYNVTTVLNHTITGNAPTTPWSVRGYTSTPGDLEGIDHRTLTPGTDMPQLVISGGGNLLFDEDHGFMSHIAVDNTVVAQMNFSMEDMTVTNCKFEFTGGSYTGNCITGGQNTNWIDCSFRLAGTTTSDAMILAGLLTSFIGCDFTQENGDTDTRGIENCFEGLVMNCTFNGIGDAIYGHPKNIINCSFHDTKNRAIFYNNNTTYNNYHKVIANCIFSNLPTAIAQTSAVSGLGCQTILNCLFHSVTTETDSMPDTILNLGSQTTSTDPFTDRTSGDFSLSSSSPALASNFTSTQFSFLENLDIGAIQSAGSGGGSPPTSWTVHPLRGTR